MRESAQMPSFFTSALILSLSRIFFLSLSVFSASLYQTSSSSSIQSAKSQSLSSLSSSSSTRTLDSSNSVILQANSTIPSENRTFELGFYTPNHQLSNWYLAIWYASIPVRTYVWVANRQIPVKNITSAAVELTADDGRLKITDSVNFIVWETENEVPGAEVKLLETGNLVLLSAAGDVVWQSFDYPTDTWLPGMNLTSGRSLTCWKSLSDPAPGEYSLRLRPLEYGEFELVSVNGTETVQYWTTGNWTGSAFTNVPEMTVPYIYKFYFNKPFTPMASFGFTETALESELRPPLSRFHVDFGGQFRQYTWSPQTENWNMFWSQPENRCRVYGLCGNLGFCLGGGGSDSGTITLPSKLCVCINGFEPADEFGWQSGDFSGGCRRIGGGDGVCDEKKDGFEEVGVVSFDGAPNTVSLHRSRGMCEKACLENCSCIGLFYDENANLCKNLYGPLMNLKNFTSDNTFSNGNLYVRVGKQSLTNKRNLQPKVLMLIGLCGFIALTALMVVFSLLLRRRMMMRRRKKKEEESALSLTNLKAFTYKELHAATRGFSEKLGHGGFGTVFQGILSDSSPVAVKRLERPGGGEKEFRAEVCTIGNVQHVNLVRLRGFCSENSHRLLVYDYMPNGPLSAYLKRDGQNLSWDVRFRIAIGTAKALAYLHEGCRDCIVHCDIKPENILLDYDYTPKVSDFGLAKLIGRDFSRVLATMRGTWGYVAPEWISGVAITPKADVYSYGMTLLELTGGRRNVEAPPSSGGGGGEDKWFFPPWAAKQIIEGNMAAVVDQRLDGTYDKAEAERVAMVAVWCIQDEESARPSMGMVVKMLEGVVEVTVPPPPKLLQALVAGESFPGVGVDSSDVAATKGGCSGYDIRVSDDSDSGPSRVTASLSITNADV
ncbi:hypothetical protein Ancab_036964 [Ancistrocladus abbreviatus]